MNRDELIEKIKAKGRAIPVKCTKCGIVDDTDMTPRTASVLCDPHEWQYVLDAPAPPKSADAEGRARELRATKLRAFNFLKRYTNTDADTFELLADFAAAETSRLTQQMEQARAEAEKYRAMVAAALEAYEALAAALTSKEEKVDE
jgi:hypothetical protein